MLKILLKSTIFIPLKIILISLLSFVKVETYLNSSQLNEAYPREKQSST